MRLPQEFIAACIHDEIVKLHVESGGPSGVSALNGCCKPTGCVSKADEPSRSDEAVTSSCGCKFGSKEGYEYVCDWVLDDQPVELRTKSTPITSIPYTQECNDVAMMLIQHHPAREYLQRAKDQFDQRAKDSEDSARVMALVVHPYIMAAPHRLKYLDQALTHIRADERSVFMTGAQILDWHRQTATHEALATL